MLQIYMQLTTISQSYVTKYKECSIIDDMHPIISNDNLDLNTHVFQFKNLFSDEKNRSESI